jgi:hypothetical protein
MLIAMGAGGTCSEIPRSEAPQPCPSGYQLKHGSRVVGAGVNLTASPYNLNPGARDYFGRAIAHRVGSGYNIGADGAAP